MLKVFLNLLCIYIVCNSVHIETLTKQTLQQIKVIPDYVNHFVFFHEPTVNELESVISAWKGDYDIKFYLNDCKGNKLPQCDDPEMNPLLLIFNRVIIKYNGDPKNIQDMAQWINGRILKSVTIIGTKQQLIETIQKTNNWFCFCTDEKKSDEQATFAALAKTLPFLNYCIINNLEYITELGLKPGNITYIKTNTTDREEFPYPNRLDSWEWFLKNNLLHTIPRARVIGTERFAQKEKNLTAYILTCDFSFRCEKVLERVNALELQLLKQKLGFDFYIAIQDQKESSNFNLYYHLSFDLRKLPAFLHIHIFSDKPAAGKLVRHIVYTDVDFSVQKLLQFKTRVDNNEYQPFYFSDALPAKNGFTGKGSEKFIQKVVAKNIEQVIAASNNHYFLLFTALDIGCTTCETFYQEYKQIAALLIEKDVTFGLINVNKNEIPTQEVTQFPQILLYKKDNKTNPIRMTANHNFPHLMKFIEDTLGRSYSDPDQL